MGPNPSATMSSEEFQFRDQTYIRPPLLDMQVIYNRLSSKCHTSKRLRKEGYILPSELIQGTGDNRNQTIMASRPSSLEPKRKAVALNCEMAEVRNGDSEIISISVVDFFSGEILINSLVKPNEPIIAWRSNVHGIRPATMSIAVSKGQVLRGWEVTRQELFKHINTDTVLIGQSLQQDLKSLRISHEKIIDTAILTAEAAFGTNESFGRRWSLQSLCADLLKLGIRQGSNTHDALEDSMAVREVALWCLCYPDKLEQWGKRARQKYITEKVKKAERRRQRRRSVHYSSYIRDDDDDNMGYHYDYSYDDEVLRWEDVVDWEMWPKSPPSD
ncbi:RNA exonuclease 3 [Fusarium austroafricanum]|uniref:RNA exonuclease 3 n=1 Tax=Fusarium austroafricanum TaxID=2364996 RepID=A0A8H4P6S0_9HYPO|nr:RNA exonuclease 3 [Fusarium austroafricanum]